MILKYSEKYQHQFLHVLIFGNMFPESHGFVAVPIKRSNNFVSLDKLLDRDKLEHLSLMRLVTGIVTLVFGSASARGSTTSILGH